ncbi:MAG: hypothetical protein ACYDAM_12135, partial [Leptospirales bacterium]
MPPITFRTSNTIYYQTGHRQIHLLCPVPAPGNIPGQLPRPEGRSLRFKRSLQTATGALTDALDAILIAAFQSAFRE